MSVIKVGAAVAVSAVLGTLIGAYSVMLANRHNATQVVPMHCTPVLSDTTPPASPQNSSVYRWM